jgi:hypothetical protein
MSRDGTDLLATGTAADREQDECVQFAILDIPIRLQVEEPEFASITHSFMGAYAPSAAAAIDPGDGLEFSVRRVAALPASPNVEVAVHRTRHPYWNFSGLTDSAGEMHVWPTRGISIERMNARSWRIGVRQDVDAQFAAEAVFHAIRSLALYHRPAGNMLHGSAVASGDRLVAFVGPSMAGKTTLMTRMLAKTGCDLFANDRFLVLPDASLQTLSWPSYASFCEGHLLGDAALATAARWYETEDCTYRTRRWGVHLSDQFDKAGKRTYPMCWLREVYGRPYRTAGRLAAIVLCQVSPDLERTELRELNFVNTDREQALNCLRASAFDDHEPSFLPWHGLPTPRNAPELCHLLDRLSATGGKLIALDVPVSQLDEATGLLGKALALIPEPKNG